MKSLLVIQIQGLDRFQLTDFVTEYSNNTFYRIKLQIQFKMLQNKSFPNICISVIVIPLLKYQEP